MHQPLTARREASPTGVIETLSAGYAAVNRRPWVLLLPILLNVFLWLGPHVSYSPLVGPAVTGASEWTRQVASGPRRSARDTAGLTGQAGVDIVNGIEQSRQWLIALSDDTNGFQALAWGPLALPSLDALPSASQDIAFVNGWGDGLALLGACLGLSLLLGGWFYGGLAAASRQDSPGLRELAHRIPRAILHVLGLVGVLFCAALLFGVPVLLLIGFTAVVSPPIAVLGSILLCAGVLFASVHLFFSIPAIFVSNAGPLLAIQRSVGVVRRHLWPSVALMLLTWLILAGMGRVWEVLANQLQSPYGVMLGILGNAYIASGLIAAGMVFYTQRTEPASGPSAAPTT